MKSSLQFLIEEVSDLVQQATGVQLGENQTDMVKFRLSKRMTDLDLDEPDDYMDFIEKNKSEELKVLISLLTTHHTFFFREFGHFEYLESKALPTLIEKMRAEGRKSIRVWSAACSRGQEVYSLSMFLNSVLRRLAPDFTYEILGTDVDHESVAISKNGVYRWEEVKEIPAAYLANHWIRGTGDIADFVKARDSIKSPCRFETLNLFEVRQDKPLGSFDIIFCRNVFIYFKPDQVKQLSQALLSHLSPHGYLFTGMSESLGGHQLPVHTPSPAIYMHESAKPSAQSQAAKPAAAGAPALNLVPMPAGPTRVLIVDDSGTIVTLLKKILSKEEGFEVVGVAENGVKAAELAQKLKFDVMTLDIHMPEMDGVAYLAKHFKAGIHPPVVMISSVSREDSSLGLKALELGATDYIEKPSLQNLVARSSEIRTKLKLAVQSPKLSVTSAGDLGQAFKKTFAIKNFSKTCRVIIGGIGDRERIKRVLSFASGPQPVTYILLHGPAAVLATTPALFKGVYSNAEFHNQFPENLGSNAIAILDYSTAIKQVQEKLKNKRVSLMVFGDVSKEVSESATGWNQVQLIVEDLPQGSKEWKTMKEISSYCIPYTSFLYHSDQFLSEEP